MVTIVLISALKKYLVYIIDLFKIFIYFLYKWIMDVNDCFFLKSPRYE